IVGLAVLVADAVLRLLALAAGAHVVSAGEWRQLEHPRGAERLVDRRSGLVGMVSHGDVVGMVFEVHHRYRHPVLVLFGGMQSDAIARLRQILTDEPHAGEMIVHLDDLCVFETRSARNGVSRY